MEVREVETTYGNDHQRSTAQFHRTYSEPEKLCTVITRMDYWKIRLQQPAQLSGWTGKEICMPPKAEEYDAAMDVQIAKEQIK